MTSPIRTVLIDDQVLFREAIRSLLAAEKSILVVGEGGNGEDALRLAADLRPHVMLMDLRMPLMAGTEATRRIRSLYPEMQVLILTTFDQEKDVFDALRVGASGYILKDTPANHLVEAIKAVARGETWLQPSVATRVVAELNRLSQFNSGNLTETDQRILKLLSQRELDIVRKLVRGMSNKEIAAALSITEGTVKNHMTSILAKFQAQDRTGVALKARDLGIS